MTARTEHDTRATTKDGQSPVAGSEAILRTLPDPLIMLDREARIVRVNPAAEQEFGRNLKGRPLSAVLAAPEVTEAVAAVLDGLEGEVIEFSVPGPLDRFFGAHIAGLDPPGVDGTAVIVSLYDLTAAKRAERLRADFVANASHELRTPLSSLIGFIETLSGPARDDEEARARFLAIMYDQAQRMARLIEDLLSLSRIEMDEHSAPTTLVDLERVLSAVVGSLEHQASDKDMTIELDVSGLPPIIGDRDNLAQVFQNLIDNAVKYGRAGTPVTITAKLHAESDGRLDRPAVSVAVSDRGEGVSKEHLERLTERFYRVDTARSRALGGTGLGLAIVKHIVNRHRGLLEIDSKLGNGSTFTVHLPVADSTDPNPLEF